MTQKKPLRDEALRDRVPADAPPPENAPRRFRYGIRHLIILVTLVGSFLGGFLWCDRTYRQPLRLDRSIRMLIVEMQARRPPELTPLQWENAVGWTINLHSNSLLPFQADVPTMRAFEMRLSKKLEGNVNLATIDWIWDEYARICPGGAEYQKYRAIMNEHVAAGS